MLLMSHPLIFRVSALLFALLLSLSCLAEDNSISEAQYSGKYGRMKVQSTRTLKAIDASKDIYSLESIVSNRFAEITEKSTFYSIRNLLMPSSYYYQRSMLGFKSERDLKFDWTEKKVHYTREDKPEKNLSYDIAVGVLDPSLYQLKLQADAFLGLEEFHYTFAKARKIKNIDFKKTGTTQFKMGKQLYDAIVVERYLHSDNKTTKVTLIPEFAFQIAEIVHTEEDGKQYIIRLEDFKFNQDRLKTFYSALSTAEQTGNGHVESN